MAETPDVELPEQLRFLATLVDERPESLASNDKNLADTALAAAKYLFDLGVASEEKSAPCIGDLLSSFSPAEAPQTRSQTRANGKRKRDPSPPPERPILQRTSLPSLFIDGMDDEQLWAQLELRSANVCRTLQLALQGAGEDADLESEPDAPKKRIISGDGEDEMLEEAELMSFDEDSEEDEESSDEDEEDEEDGEDGDLGESITPLRDPSDDEDEEIEPARPSKLPRLKLKGPKPRAGGHPELDDGFFDLAAFNAETEAAEARSSSKGRLSRDSDDEDEEDEDVDMFADVDGPMAFDEEEGTAGEATYADFFAPPARTPAKPKKTAAASPPRRQSKVRFHEEVRVKSIKPRGKNLPLSTMDIADDDDEDEELDFGFDGDEDEDGDYEGGFDEDEGEDEDSEGDEGDEFSGFDNLEEEGEDEDEEDMDEDGEEDEGRDTMARLQNDLFADDDEEEDDDLSTFEKRQAAIQEQIDALEQENIGKKDWTLMGEATSRSRPSNSLLEEDLEFERVMKAVPVVTEEVVQRLEDRIKARIQENRFDDVVRRRAVDEKPFLPSRFFELQDTKSKQSLAEIYEDEYTAAQTGASSDDRDGKLKKEHEELEKIWEGLSYKLDALSNAHFTPKAPKATITTVTNVASASMESTLPTAKSAATMLAPEEVYQPASASALRAKSELTPEENRTLHNKHKKARRKARDALDNGVDKWAKLNGAKGAKSVKAQKEAALKSVVKHGKGVTVVGKKSQDNKKGQKKA
ncbi:Mpp10 protein [Peniophora sp. CONT]|nr:Mpp10 protein [Peniophora sp. CONT]